MSDKTTQMRGNVAVGVNGVPFDPGAAEFWRGDPSSGWQYEALSGAVPLGVDANHAHVQPTGTYHYHGLPWGLMEQLNFSPEQHSPLIGWAADGFPVYALTGYSDPNDAGSSIKTLKSSYQIKSGQRPGGNSGPGGAYDGTFIRDYEFIARSGDLDECNGRVSVTPEFPEGTYAYFLTEDWPVIPRSFRGTPDASFSKRGGGPGGMSGNGGHQHGGHGGGGWHQHGGQGGHHHHQRPSGAQLLQRMDSNGDGLLSRQEVAGPLANDFTRADANKDGYLSAQEIDSFSKRR
jgi:hypothetical protein